MNDDDRSIESRLGALGDAMNDALDRRPLEPSGGRRSPRSSHSLLAVAAAALVVAGGAGIWALSAGRGDDSSAIGGAVDSSAPPTGTEGDAVTTVPPPGPTGDPVTTMPILTTVAVAGTEQDPGQITPPTTGITPGSSSVAIGDAVMQRATVALMNLGFAVETEEAAQVSTMLSTTASMVDELDPDVVVIHLGTNGTISTSDADALMDAVADVPRVVVLTLVGEQPWIAPNNELIESLPVEHSNVVVLPWDSLAALCPGDCFGTDGMHLGADGAQYYAGLIALVAGVEAAAVPTLPGPPTTVAPATTSTTVAEPVGDQPTTTAVIGMCPDGSVPETYSLVPGDFPAQVAVKLDVELTDLELMNADNPEWEQWFPGSVIFVPCN